MNNTTKDGIEVKPGQIWRDLDKRMGNRQRQVVRVEFGKAVMGTVGRYKAETDSFRTRVSISRMHRHSTGWELVSEAQQ